MTTHEFEGGQELGPDQILQAGTPVIEFFGIEADPVADSENFVAAINQLDPRFQGERPLVRYELEQDTRTWPEGAETAIMQAAEGMGMLREETPLVGEFDVIAALGGARMAPYDRVWFMTDAIYSGQVSGRVEGQRPKLVAIGSTREVKPDEAKAAEQYAEEPKIEYHLMRSAVDKIESITDAKIEPMLTAKAKANTEDSVRQIIGKFKKDSPDFRLGLVTTQIYQAFTQCDAERVARDYEGVTVQVGGNPSDPEIVAKRTPSTYLSEVIRTLRAASQALRQPE